MAYSKVRFLLKRTPMASIYSEWHEPGNDFRPKRKRSLGKNARNHEKLVDFTSQFPINIFQHYCSRVTE